MAKGEARQRKAAKNGADAKGDKSAGSKKSSKASSAVKPESSSGVCMKLIILLVLVGVVVGALFAFGVVTPDQIPGLEELTKRDVADSEPIPPEAQKQDEVKKEAPKVKETKKEPPKPKEKKEPPKPKETKKEPPKHAEKKQEQPKPAETKKEAPKPADTKKEPPKPAETKKEQPKPVETKKEPPKPAETKKEPPKPKQEPPKPAETKKEQPKTETKQEPPKPAETKQEPPKPAETKKEPPKPVETKKEVPKSKEEQPKPAETNKETPKPAETKKEPAKETKKEPPKPAETKKEEQKPVETKKETSKQETKSKPAEAKREVPKQEEKAQKDAPAKAKETPPKPAEETKIPPKPEGTKQTQPKEAAKEQPKQETPKAANDVKKDAATQTEEKKKPAKKSKLSPEEAEITNERDEQILPELKDAETLLDKGKPELALRRFENLLKSYPSSPRVRWGRARSLDSLAEERRSNDILQSCIQAYSETADAEDCPKMLKKYAMLKAANRLAFFGKVRRASNIYFNLAEEFPDDIQIKKDLGVQLLVGGMNSQAKPVFEDILKLAPNDGFAKIHLGFIVKAESDYERAIPLLQEGLDSGEIGTQEGKYFFHLGDALYRVGKPEESYKVYQKAADRGFFRSVYQRSLYNVETLKAKPWWTAKDARFALAQKTLEENWEAIRDEGMSLLDPKSKLFSPEDEGLSEKGDWKQFTIFQQGQKNEENCKKAPKTCAIVDAIDDAATCKRGQVKFSVMHPGTHVWPHCGPTNCRLRSHLGLVIPDGCRIRVANETKQWEEGKLMIFDDSFEHEVWQDADSVRLILIVDFWHPGLTNGQKHMLTPI